MARKRKKSDLRLYLQDEAPRVGSGWRGVQVVKVGRVWVHLRETSTGIAFKLPMEVYKRAARELRPVATTNSPTIRAQRKGR